MKKLIALCFALLLIVTACANEPKVQDPEAPTGTLTFLGLAGIPELTIAELQELDTYSGEGNTVNSANEETSRSFTGARLDKVLAHYGLSLDGVTAVVVNAGDGYSVEIPKPILKNRELILAWEIDGVPLEGKDAPLRMVVPEERTLYWVRNVVELVFTFTETEPLVEELTFFENILPEFSQETYTYYGSEDHAVDLSQVVGGAEQVTLIAKDGLVKFENLKSELKYYIKIDGQDAPQFISPSIPKGMYVKNLALVFYGKQAIIFASSFSDQGQVDIGAAMELMAPYLGETLLLNLPGKAVSGSKEEIAALELSLTQQGVIGE